MTETNTTEGARLEAAPSGTVRVWDPLVRLIHWGVAIAVLLNATAIDEESQVHQTIGYLAVGLVIIRLVWGLVGPSHARFSAFPPNPVAALRHVTGLLTGKRPVHLSHNPLGALMVYNLWASVIGMGITGYMMTTPRYYGMEWVEELHEGLFAWLMISVALHLGGVLLDSLLTRVNLVRAMIDGRKRLPRQGSAR